MCSMLQPQNPTIFAAIGLTYHQSGRLDKAIENYHQSLGLKVFFSEFYKYKLFFLFLFATKFDVENRAKEIVTQQIYSTSRSKNGVSLKIIHSLECWCLSHSSLSFPSPSLDFDYWTGCGGLGGSYVGRRERIKCRAKEATS